MTTKTKTTSKPLEHIRFGHVEAAIWANEGPDGRAFHTFSIYRKYQNKKGELDRSISFTQADAELVAEVVKRATVRLGELADSM